MLLAVVALAAPAAARADSRVTIDGGQLVFLNEDVTVANKLVVDYQTHNGEQDIHFYDESDPKGISTYPTPPCSPGKTNAQGNPIEIFCTKASIKGVSIDVGPREDSVVYNPDQTPVSLDGNVGADSLTAGASDDQVTGGQGNDTIAAGAGDDEVTGDDGDDTIQGGDGNDKIDGGAGADRIDAGGGDDTIVSDDGIADTIDCGPGTDGVTADTVDTLSNCENVQKHFVTPPAGADAGDDHRPPVLQAGARTLQRIGRHHRRIVIAATADEPGLVQVTSYLAAGGINDPMPPARAKLATPGGGVTIRLRLTARQLKLALSQLRHHRRPALHVSVAATDAAGNASRPRRFTIMLRG